MEPTGDEWTSHFKAYNCLAYLLKEGLIPEGTKPAMWRDAHPAFAALKSTEYTSHNGAVTLAVGMDKNLDKLPWDEAMNGCCYSDSKENRWWWWCL